MSFCVGRYSSCVRSVRSVVYSFRKKCFSEGKPLRIKARPHAWKRFLAVRKQHARAHVCHQRVRQLKRVAVVPLGGAIAPPPRASMFRPWRRQDVVVVVGDAVATLGVIKRHAYDEAASSSAAAPNRFVAFAMPSWVDRRMEATCAALREEAAAAKTAEKAALKAQKAALRAAVGC